MRQLIINKNQVSKYLIESVATPLPLMKNNDSNWFTINEEYRHSFMLENQFKTFYTDYLLKAISDLTTIYKEYRYIKKDIADSFIDNIVKINGKYILVKIKLSILVEKNIIKQVSKYCHDNLIILDSKENKTCNMDIVINDRVLIIDTNSIYIFDYMCKNINNIKSYEDILKVKDIIIRQLGL